MISSFFQRGAWGAAAYSIAGFSLFIFMPNGKTMNNVTHQTLMKVKMAKVKVMRQTCSSSTSVPQKSLGCRNNTGLPWAPIFGSPSPRTRAPAFSSLSRAA